MGIALLRHVIYVVLAAVYKDLAPGARNSRGFRSWVLYMDLAPGAHNLRGFRLRYEDLRPEACNLHSLRPRVRGLEAWNI